MKSLLALLVLVMTISGKNISLDQTTHFSLSCKEENWLSMSSSPSSGFVWYSPSNDFILQEDTLGFYNAGFQYFNIKCSDKAVLGSTYGINFYYVDATYELISTFQATAYISNI
ncbi:hypothetical protein SteCoe_4370 [Stentor coeruleus]|uniref:Ig-like domain-containing protein n=1 Tax=Stentor coeruleus TaxID=5963 RepID=A0A1R2CUY3_9CILI|nr:hypothetical protein SteCoe_4370 [Stentor coeruleus]